MPKRDKGARRGDTTDATRREIKRRPNAAPPVFRLTRQLLERSDPEAQQWLPSLERFPDYAEGWAEIGETLLHRNQSQAALHCFQRALAATNPPVNARLGAASCHLAHDRPAQAIGCLTAGDRPASRDARVMALLGKARYAAGETEAAEQDLVTATEANSEDAGSWYRLGLVRHEHGRYREATAAYERALQKGPTAIQREAAFNMGVARQASGDREGAINAYREAVRIDPDCTMRAVQALSSSATGLVWIDLAAARRFLGAE